MYNLEENLDVEFDYSPFFKSLEKLPHPLTLTLKILSVP